MTVSPATATVVQRDTLRLTATATNVYGQVVTGVEFEWASGNTAVAAVDSSGLVTGVGAGQAEVTATAAGVTGRAELAVVAPLPTTVVVTPDTVVLTAFGQTVQLAAEVRDQIGRVMDGAPVSWSSADTTVAVVDSTGLARAVGSGAATAVARARDAAGDAHVTVMQSARSVTVSPAEETVALGDTLRLLAEARDENGHPVEGAAFTWSSSDAAVAAVDPSGLVRGAREGTATITARADEAASASSEITVSNPDRAALAALYEATDGPNWVDDTNWLTDAPLGEWYGVRTDATGRVVRLDLNGRWDSETRETVQHGLRGKIPPEIGELGSLQALHLEGNELTGGIPTELGGLANLQSLDLGSNQLTGEIPTEIGELTNLRILELYNNPLTGEIPAEIGNLVNLEYLSLYGGNLSGEIPVEIGSLVNLRFLYITNNRLTGKLPAEIGNLVNLESLSMGYNRLTGEIPPELGNLANLHSILLSSNQLTGAMPSEMGNLASLETLAVRNNQLTGPIPSSFLRLALRGLHLGWNESLCVPGTSGFLSWLRGIDDRDEQEQLCNAADVTALESIYQVAGGAGWIRSTGWMGDGAVEEWEGVVADSLGRVVELDLAGNNLTGSMPAGVVALSRLQVLRMGDNRLFGRLPRGLAGLPMRELHYAGTEVCVPAGESFGAWLASIPSHEGTGIVCSVALTDREILEVFFHATGGPDWSESQNWLTNAPLNEWHGVETDAAGRVVGLLLGSPWQFQSFGLKGRLPPEVGDLDKLRELGLWSTELSGPIPPELGTLADLTYLWLYNTDLSGRIPVELGNLGKLVVLDLENNRLSGDIPLELGNLANLRTLLLNGNQLEGSIPSELGELENLNFLYLSDNELSGTIPSGLGGLAHLRALHLDFNRLSGPVPPAFRGMTSLVRLTMGGNEELRGRLPLVLTQLRDLDVLVTSGTGLCAPADAPFQTWLGGLSKRRVAPCVEAAPPSAYLTQAVQSFEYPVPLVAGRRALLRVFPTAATGNSADMPAVRARFYVNGRETRVVDVPSGPGPVPTAIDEGSLASSVNAEIPGQVIGPGLEMVVELDPDGALDPALGVTNRIPETGRTAVEVRRMPTLDLTVIPFVWSETHDSTIVDLVLAMAAGPESHEMLGPTRSLLPVGGIEVTAHEPVVSSSNSAFDLLGQTAAIREMEGGTGHYKGMMSPPVTDAGGVAYLPGRNSFSQPYAGIVAHELGHNFNLQHAPCGGAGGPDPGYPYRDGTIGAWGYDFDAGSLVHPETPDLMSYCGPIWVSDYYFEAAFRFRLEDEGAPGAAAALPVRSLLLWGGTGADSVPFLEPAFVVDAPPSLPTSRGDHRITGTAADGSVLFSLDFVMTEMADGEGHSGFTFLLPVEPAWEARLAAITLSGPAGTATLDGDSDIAMAILRDPRTGQVRGILRDPPLEAGVAADAAVGAPGLEVLFSRGIPGAAAWRR